MRMAAVAHHTQRLASISAVVATRNS